ncbi:MAG: extracellular solute-binding protein [Lachnospiraceae bacterium]|nr:extracellular solute-binding protein [Lachnospiraceae bacterium]
MKKSLIALLLLLALSTGLLAACHGKGVVKPTVSSTSPSTSSGTDSGTGEAPLSFDTSRKHTISFWAKNDSNPTQKAIYEKAKKDFEALYPNITVEIRPYSDYGKIYQDVITNIVTRTTPNVCISYPDHIATYLKGQDVVIDLDRYMADPNYGFGGKELLFDGPGPDELIDKFMEEGFFDGHQYDLPFMRSSEALYINKDMVNKLGYEIPEIVSWDWIWEISEKAMEKNGDIFKVNGQKILIPFMYKSTDNMMIQMLRQKEAGYATSRGEVQLFNETAKELLYTIYQHVNTRAFSTFKIDSYPGNFFNAGRCIFAIDSTAGATWMGSHAPLLDIHASDVVEFETVVLPIPQFNPEKVQMISQGPSLCIFNKEDPQEVLASWLFAQYLLSNEVQIAYAKTEGYVPVTKKAQEAPEYQDYLARAGEDHKEHYDVKIKASQMVMAHMDDTFITPVFAGSTSVRDAAGAMIETVAKGTRRKQVVLNPAGTALDESYLKGVFDEVSRLYKLDEIELKPADPSQTPETAPAAPAETKEGETPATPGSAAPTAPPAATESAPATEKEPLPSTARFLLGSLVAVWVLLGIAALIGYLRKKKKS